MTLTTKAQSFFCNCLGDCKIRCAAKILTFENRVNSVEAKTTCSGSCGTVVNLDHLSSHSTKFSNAGLFGEKWHRLFADVQYTNIIY